LKSVVEKLEGHPELLKKYDTVFKDQLENGVIEKVEQTKKMVYVTIYHTMQLSSPIIQQQN